MKFKFGKKPTGYFESLREQHADLTRQIEKTQADIHAAEADLLRCNQQYNAYLERSRSEYLDRHGVALRQAQQQADSNLQDCQWALSQLELKITPIRWKLEAPETLNRASQTLERLRQLGALLARDIEQVSTNLVKLHERAASLEERLARESRAAGLALLDEGTEFNLPESIAKLEWELKIVRSTLAEESLRLESLKADQATLPEERREARAEFIGARARVAEIELEDSLQAFLPLIARAVVARAEAASRSLPRHYGIDLPQALMETTRATLNSEVPV